jgi:hypothetical protein
MTAITVTPPTITAGAATTWGNNRANYFNTFDPYNVTNQWTRDPADRRKYFVASALWAMPFGKGKRFVDRRTGNWTVQAIATLASGQYYSPLFTGPDPANATQGFVTQLPDCIGDPDAGARTISRWFNPAAFSIPGPAAGRYGTCGMNVLEGYPIHVAHVSFAKRVPMGERASIVFTAQASNVTNTAHFTIPNHNLSNPNPGVFTAASLPGNEWAERMGPRRVFLKVRVEW